MSEACTLNHGSVGRSGYVQYRFRPAHPRSKCLIVQTLRSTPAYECISDLRGTPPRMRVTSLKVRFCRAFTCDLPIEPETFMSAYGVSAVESARVSLVMTVTRGNLCGVAGRSRGKLASRVGTSRCPPRRER